MRTVRIVCAACDGHGHRSIADPQWLAEKREAAGLTKSQFARHVGKSLSYISRIEKGVRHLRPEHPTALAYSHLRSK